MKELAGNARIPPFKSAKKYQKILKWNGCTKTCVQFVTDRRNHQQQLCYSANSANDFLSYFKAVKQVTWHGKGDYLSAVIPDGIIDNYNYNFIKVILFLQNLHCNVYIVVLLLRRCRKKTLH